MLKKILKYTLILTLFINLMGMNAPVSFADHIPGHPAEAATETQIDRTDVVTTIAKTAQLVDNVFDPLIHYFTFNIGNFLGNDYIFGAEMGQMLRSIWIVTRNIVNVAFALILLFLAVKYIFSSDESTDLKKLLPKFVILMILVNFSWLGSRVILDAANVTTNVVFAIPSGVKGTMDEALLSRFNANECKKSEDANKAEGSCALKAAFYPFGATEVEHQFNCTDDQLKTIQEENEANYPEGQDPVNANARFGKATFCWETMDIAKYNQNTASYYLSYSMAKVQNLPLSNTGEQITKVAFASLLSLIIQLIYLIAFIALYVALIFRVAMLWILIAFSPAIVLLYFIKDLQIPTGSVEERFSLQSFVSLAFAPAAVGAVWSVAFIMIITGQTVGKDFFALFNKSGEVTSHVYSSQSLFMGMDNIQEFIWLLMTIGIIWMGTFAILGKMPVVGSLFQTVQSYGTGAAKWLATRPKIAPIIPLYDYNTKTMSMSGLTSGKRDTSRFNDDSLTASMNRDALTRHFNSNSGKLDVDVSFDKNNQSYDKFLGILKNGNSSVDNKFIANNEDFIQRMIEGSKLEGVDKKAYATYIIKTAKSKIQNPSVPTGPAPAAAAAAAATANASETTPEERKNNNPQVDARSAERAEAAKEASRPEGEAPTNTGEETPPE